MRRLAPSHWSIATGGSKSHANPNSTVLFVAQIRAGGVASITTNVCVQVALLLQPSSASQVRVTEKVPPQNPTEFVVVLVAAIVMFASRQAVNAAGGSKFQSLPHSTVFPEAQVTTRLPKLVTVKI